MDFGFTEEQRLLRDSMRKLMAKHATPDYVRRHDRERTYPEELFPAWVEAGLLALPFPEEYGGGGGSVLDMAIVAEEIARTSADLVMAYAGNIFCGSIWCAGRRRSRSASGCRNFLPEKSNSRSRCRSRMPGPTSTCAPPPCATATNG